MRITILIPTVNRPTRVFNLIKSISEFGIDFVDICVSVNGADQNTLNLLTPFKNNSTITLLIWKKILPISEHWALAINTIKTELILILSDDDKLINKKWIIEIKELFESNVNAVVGFGNYIEVNEINGYKRNVKIKLPQKGNGREILALYKSTFQGYPGFGLPLLCTVFKKSAYLDCGGIDIKCLSCDTYLFCKILTKGEYLFSEQTAASYSLHEDNISKSLNLKMLFSDVVMSCVLFLYLLKNNEFPSIRWAFRFHFVFARRLLGAIRRNYLGF